MEDHGQEISNRVELCGVAASDLRYSHEVCGERFYRLEMEIERLSREADVIPLLISERIVDVSRSLYGRNLSVTGQLRSYTKHYNGSHYLEIAVFVFSLSTMRTKKPIYQNVNYIEGALLRRPIVRQTERGREVAELLVNVTRGYTKHDYIPCVLWNRNATYSRTIKPGTRIRLSGRLQSRVIRSNKTAEGTRLMVELSANRIELVERRDEIAARPAMVAENGTVQPGNDALLRRRIFEAFTRGDAGDILGNGGEYIAEP